MEIESINKHWWYRLVKVIFCFLMLAYIAIGIWLMYISIDNYNLSTEQYKQYKVSEEQRQEFEKETQELYKRFGESIPVIDSLIGLDSYKKGEEAVTLTKLDSRGNYYIDSKNHNGYHYLRPNEINMFLKAKYRLAPFDPTKYGAKPIFTSDPKQISEMIIGWLGRSAIYLSTGFFIFWIIRRTFFYIITGVKFFRL